MPSTDFDPQTDLDVARHMMAQGQMAAAIDGVHLINWGLTIASILLLQYFAEALDWLPSSQLWLWQPILFIAVAISLLLGRRAPARRRSHEAPRTYVTAFAGVGFILALYVIASGLAGRPDQFTLVLLSSGLLGFAFLLTAFAIRMPALQLATVGWWLTFAFFCFKGRLVLSDFFILSGAFALFMILPGLYLTARRRHLAYAAA